MRGSYNFQGQLSTLTNIFETNINLTEKANTYLNRMCPRIISKIVTELREEFEQQYKNLDDDKLISIKNTLNMVEKEKVTNLDFLFLGLAQEINTYYNKSHFSLKKTIPFRMKCQICLNCVANDKYSFELHKSKCQRRKFVQQKLTPQMKNKKKKIDTKQLYQKRLTYAIDASQSTLRSEDNENTENDEKKSKNQMMKQKKKIKSNPNSVELFNKILKKQRIKHDKEQQNHIGQNLSQSFSYFFQQSEVLIKYNQGVSELKMKKQKKEFKLQAKIKANFQLFEEGDEFLDSS